MVGAGQLARMTCQAAISLGIGFRVLADSAGDSAAQVCAGTVVGDYTSLPDLRAFAGQCDVITFDHEHVPGQHLAALERSPAAVHPGAASLRFTQDKLAMRERLGALGVRCPRYVPVSEGAETESFAAEVGWPVVLKAVRGGYDGRGVWVCGTPAMAAGVLPHGQAAAYPVVQTVQRDGVCHEVLAPAPGLDAGRAKQAQRIALQLAASLGVTGLLAVELFDTPGGLLVNELAMRPHNSGHWTIEGAATSQFEQHLRAVLDLPLGDPRAVAPCVVMANVFGSGDEDVYGRYAHVMAADPGVKVHLYGKAARPGRKIGHVTVPGNEVGDLRARAARAATYLGSGKE